MNTLPPAALGELVARHGAALALYARQWCDTPDDVVQEALLGLMSRQPPPDRPLAWLYKAVRHRALNERRAASRRSRHERQSAQQRNAWFEPNPGRKLDADAATRALQALPEKGREVLIARLWGGLTFEDIAELTGRSVGTCHRAYVQGLERLRRLLDQGGSPPMGARAGGKPESTRSNDAIEFNSRSP